ncbi:hypothetical protein OPQ81_005243 [Rhizoctonia solani]|nr:hypothetical protein OPQ81_005243 [Rhizoctonia solani]
METESAVSTSRPATPALVHSPSTARSSFSQPPMPRPCPTRQASWGKRHASLDSPKRPNVGEFADGISLGSSLPTPTLRLRDHTRIRFYRLMNHGGDARPSVSVDIHPDKYVLACRMPHFDHSSITVATRRGRLLVIAADRWDNLEPAPLSLDPALIPNPPQPAHFERRVTFGWDADMGRIRAEFDGVTLHVTVPRRLFPAPSNTLPRERASAPGLMSSELDMTRHHSQPARPTTKREVAWPLG